MILRRRGAAGGVAAGVVAVLLVLFIAIPVLAVLGESVQVSRPMPPAELRAITSAALDLLPPDRREPALTRWVAGASEAERLQGLAVAFRLAGTPVPWDENAAWSNQRREATAALAALDEATRMRVEAELPVAIVMLHKRVALAFQVRDRLDQAGFDRLRNGTETRLGLDHYCEVFDDPWLRRAALNSLGLGLIVATLTTLLGFLLAFGVNRGGVGWPGLVRFMVLIPLVSPPVLIATATLMLFGRQGLITHGLLDHTLGLIDAETANLYGLFGVVMAQVLSFLPAAFILLDAMLRRQDGRVEEAASACGASRLRIFGEVTLPLALPGLARALVLVFMMSLTDFGNPLILGRDIPVLAGVVYDEMTAFRNMPLAAALCVWLVVPAMLLFLVLERAGGRRRYATAEGAAPELALPASWRFGLSALALLVAGLVLAIYGTVAAGAVTRIWGVDWSLTLGHFGSLGIDSGLAGTGFGSSEHGLGLVWDSLRIALMAGPLGGLLAVGVAFVVDRVRPPGRDAIAFLALLPAVLPGLIIGIGYILAFNLPLGQPALSLTGTALILVLNIAFTHLTVGVLAARAALQRQDGGVDEAAESLGAGLPMRFLQVTLPMLRPALRLGTLYAFVHAMTTLSSIIFLVSGDHKLVSVAIFNDANSGLYGPAAAKSVAVLALAGLAMALIWLHDRAETRRLRQHASDFLPGARA